MWYIVGVLFVLHQQVLLSLQVCETCPDNTEEYDESCYYFSSSPSEHASANSSCSKYGYHLVFIESEEEQNFIETHMDDTDIDDAWMGLTVGPSGEAVWFDGSSLTYDNTEDDSFNEGGECFRLVESYGYTWHDRGCSYEFPFICEKEIECFTTARMSTTELLTTQPPTAEELTTEPTTHKPTTSQQSTTEQLTTISTTHELTTTTQKQATTEELTTKPTTNEPTTAHQATTEELTTTHQATTEDLTTTIHQATTEELTKTHQATTEDLTTTHQATTEDLTTTAHEASTEELTTRHQATTKELTTKPTTLGLTKTMKSTTEELTTISTTHEPTTTTTTTLESTTTSQTNPHQTSTQVLPTTTSTTTTGRSTTNKRWTGETTHSTVISISGNDFTTPPPKGHQRSKMFRKTAKNLVIVDSAVVERHSESTLIGCSSLCMAMDACSCFTYDDVRGECLLGRGTSKNDFEIHSGAQTFVTI